MSTRRWIVRVAGRAAWLVAALCVLQAAMAVIGVSFALLMRQAIDQAVAGAAEAFWAASLAFGGLMLLQVALRAANRHLSERARASLDNRFRQRALSGVLGQDWSAASSFHTGALMSRMTSDVSVVTEGAASFVPSVASMGVRIVGALAVLYMLVPTLALVFLAAGCAMALLSVALRGWLKRLHRGVQDAESDVRCFLQECLESLLVVHAFGVEAKVEDVNARNMDRHLRARMRKADASNLCSTGLTLAMQAGYVLGFVWCGFGILHGTVSYGTLMAVIQLVGQIQSPFASLGGTFSKYTSMLASAERLMELDAHAPAGGCRGARLGGGLDARDVYERMEALRFEGVTFRYGRDVVLDGFSLEVPKGRFVAVTGPSGRGKSTLVKLLLGACAPDAGRVEIAGEGLRLDVADAPAGLFAYVPQGNLLMSGTVREVVGLAAPDGAVNDAEVERACRAACADGFVRELACGYDTVLGERGAGLSEGQMQRLAVARAVYSGAPVLLLDEATSALDAVTERRMLENLRALPGRTAVVVTHRAEALALCDDVVEMGEVRHGN